MQKLLLGAAYHGNRMLHHAQNDLRDMADHNMNLVVHMFSHTDWDRHSRVMKDMVEISKECGLEVWVDNWGLGGPPGDKSFFLALHPEAHQIYSNGTVAPTQACLNAPSFRAFVKEWIDAVDYIGGKTIFWDEPHLPMDKDGVYSCTCPVCRERFEARYGHPMPERMTAETEEFRTATIVDYFEDICGYSASKGIKNSVCVMLSENIGINLDTIGRLGAIPTLDNIGSDPYWGYSGVDPYEFVYNGTKRNLEVARQYGKDHNIWIQAYGTPRGMEEEIVQATEAAYDAGARTIIAWGYFGSISNNYAAEDPYLVRATMNQAFARVRGFERDRVLAEKREKYRR